MKFNYQARTKNGKVQTGTVEASSKEVALVLLQKHALFITLLEEAGIAPIWARKIKFFERVSRKEVVIFTRQLAIMFKSKVSLNEALAVFSSQVKNLSFRDKIFNISEQVKGGTPFSKALSTFPNVFSTFYVSMVKSGEVSGTLAESLDYLADHLEREYHLYSKMTGAMVYPALILATMIVIFGIIIVFIIPQLTEVLEGSEQELPFVTVLVINLSEFIRGWWWLMFLAVGGLGIFGFQYLKTAEGKKFSDRTLLKIPVIGTFLKMIYLSRFAENLSTLISSGLPIVEALEITGEIVGNDLYKTIIFQTRDDVRKGDQISKVLKKYPEAFPPVFTQMVLVGEKSGTLDSTLMNIVDFYQKEVDRSVESLLSVLEPIMIIFLGLVVGGMVGAVLLPFYQMTAL